MSILGIHHVTAMCGDAQKNVDFYAGILGLRLVKATVNYDDPDTWHLYYGDGLGRPGSLITFFPWPGHPGVAGNGQVGVTAFSIPKGSMGAWIDRLTTKGIPFFGPEERFNDHVLSFGDPDDMPLELVESSVDDLRTDSWQALPAEMAIRGFHSATLFSARPEATVQMLRDIMGFTVLDEEDERARLIVGEGRPHQMVDVVLRHGGQNGKTGAGTVHHIAWRVADDIEQSRWQEAVTKVGAQVTPVQDRTYFHSIYFREPGGILYEIATDGPGWTVDEPLDALGHTLALPSWLEERRGPIMMRLPQLVAPDGVDLP